MRWSPNLKKTDPNIDDPCEQFVTRLTKGLVMQHHNNYHQETEKNSITIQYKYALSVVCMCEQ